MKTHEKTSQWGPGAAALLQSKTKFDSDSSPIQHISSWFNEAATIPCLGIVPPKHVLASPNATGRFLPHQRGLWSSSKKYLLTQMRSYYCELLQISSNRMLNRTRTQGQCSPGIWSLMDIKASGVNMIVKPQTAQLIRICTTEKWKTTRHWLEFPFCDCASSMSFHARFYVRMCL